MTLYSIIYTRLYCIIFNIIDHLKVIQKLTALPWYKTHSSHEIWPVVKFISIIPRLSIGKKFPVSLRLRSAISDTLCKHLALWRKWAFAFFTVWNNLNAKQTVHCDILQVVESRSRSGAAAAGRPPAPAAPPRRPGPPPGLKCFKSRDLKIECDFDGLRLPPMPLLRAL